MHAENFYQTQTEHTLPLLILGQKQCLNGHDVNAFEQNCLQAQQFTGCLGEIAVISDSEGLANKIYIGAGDCTDVQALACAVNRLPTGRSYRLHKPVSQRALVAWSLAQYRFDRYKSAVLSPRILAVTSRELSAVLTEADAVFLVRDLINMPANELGPDELAAITEKLANKFAAQFTQWVGKELLQNNFPAIHAVGRAAAAEPRLLSLLWGDANHPRVTLVGKGVCFDSGGLDLKPAAGMRLMKKDMGGAAQVIGLAQWIMTKRLPIRLQVLIPTVENAISSQSFRPGDVLVMRNGLTVEIDNTDAEGRLILADALVKACEDKPELLIDFATLTGAARGAVGTEIAAMFTNDDALAQAISQASAEVGDPVWRMPLYSGYACMLDSAIADMVNSCPSPYAGAITAALFLQRFIDEGVSWVHFDIMAWNICNKPGKPEGGEAMGIQAIAHYLLQRYG